MHHSVVAEPTPAWVDRRFMRFAGNPMETAYVDLHPKRTRFTPTLAALIFQEAYGGCGLIFFNRDQLEGTFNEGLQCMIKIGDLTPLPARAVWVKPVDSDVLKVGFEFLDKY